MAAKTFQKNTQIQFTILLLYNVLVRYRIYLHTISFILTYVVKFYLSIFETYIHVLFCDIEALVIFLCSGFCHFFWILFLRKTLPKYQDFLSYGPLMGFIYSTLQYVTN